MGGRKVISLDEFKKVIEIVKEFDKAQETLTNVLIKESTGFVDFGYPLQVLIFKLLNTVFKIEDPDLLDWWLYEKVEKIIYYPDGLKYDLTNIEDLYYYITGDFDKVKKV